MAAVDRRLLLLVAVDHVVAVGDAVAVGDDDGGAGESLRLLERPDGLHVVGPEGHGGDVGAAPVHRVHPEVFLGCNLPPRRELGHGRHRGGLRHLPAGIGVHLAVEHQDVHVAARSQDVVQPAVTDVVGPAVPADDPHALFHQVIGQGEEALRFRGIRPLQPFLERRHPFPLGENAGFGRLVRVEQPPGQFVADLRRQLPDQVARHPGVLVDRQPETQAELGVVLEERIAPGRPPPVPVAGVGRRRQVGAVDGGAPGGVGDEGPVAEKLRQQLDVGGLAAAGAGPGKLEERLEQLGGLDAVEPQQPAVVLRQLEEETEILPLGEADRGLRHHVDRLALRLLAVARGTHLHAHPAAGAILGGDLDAVHHARLEIAPLRLHVLEGGGRLLQVPGVVGLDPDARVGARQGALAALDAGVRIPRGDFQGDIALLPPGGSRRESPVHGEGAHREAVPHPLDDAGGERLHEIGGLLRNRRGFFESAGGRRGNLHLEQVRQGLFHRAEVLPDDLLPLRPVGLLDRLLDGVDRLVARQHPRNGEEAGLHDGVDPRAHPRRLRDLVAVDDVEADLPVDDLPLHAPRDPVPDLLGAVGAVQEEGGPLHGVLEHVVALQEDELVAGDEIRLVHEIGGMDRFGPEPEVRHRYRPRLARIVGKVPLGVVGRILPDDLDRILVGTDGAVRPQPVEEAARDVPLDAEIGVVIDRVAGDVVVDPDAEIVLRGLLFQFLENAADHGRGEFLRGEPVASPHHLRKARKRQGAGGVRFRERRDHVLVQRFPARARLLGPVEHRQGTHRRRQRPDHVLPREGAVEAHFQDPDLFLPVVEVLDGLLRRFRPRPHQHDHPFRVRGAGIVEQVVLPPGDGGEPVHGLLHDGGGGLVEGVRGLPRLEEDVGVLRRPADDGVVGGEPAQAMGQDQVVVDQGADILVRKLFDLHDFVRSPEPVEEVHEGNAGLERRGLGDERRVHHFLHRVRGQHRPPGGAHGHDIAVVPVDRKRVGGDGAGGDVEDRGRQLPGDLEHVGDHQEQSLRGGERGGQGACLQRAVNGPGRPPLALHLGHRGDHPPDVFELPGRPGIGPLPHRGGGSDRVDRDDFAGAVGDIGRGLVTIDGNHLPFHGSPSMSQGGA